nr:MAG TPA: hypothetical protein [Caudoviricetes sp.]
MLKKPSKIKGFQAAKNQIFCKKGLPSFFLKIQWFTILTG